MATLMAIENATARVQNTFSSAVVKRTIATMSPECALRMNVSSEEKELAGTVCADCQACHMIALTEAVKACNKSAVKLDFELAAAIYFASAELQFSLKPPIFSA